MVLEIFMCNRKIKQLEDFALSELIWGFSFTIHIRTQFSICYSQCVKHAGIHWNGPLLGGHLQGVVSCFWCCTPLASTTSSPNVTHFGFWWIFQFLDSDNNLVPSGRYELTTPQPSLISESGVITREPLVNSRTPKKPNRLHTCEPNSVPDPPPEFDQF